MTGIKPGFMRPFSVMVVLCVMTFSIEAKVFKNMEEALESVYPGMDIRKEAHFLTEEERDRAETLCGYPVEQKVIYVYQAFSNNECRGYAYFDKHRVRTLPETLMVGVTPAGQVKAIEVLVFMEPEDYLPGKKWYDQFLEKVLGNDLQIKRDIQGITGATLTARATTHAVRKILALHKVINQRDAA